MKFRAFHGVSKQEQQVGNNFTVDIKLILDLKKASKSDELLDTVSYADVYETVKDEMKIPSKLLEHAAGRIIKKIQEAFPQVEGIEVKLTKMSPPITGEMESASVVLVLS